MISTQREWDCGVCAIANVQGISWNRAAEMVWGIKYRNRLRFNTTTRQIANALGIRYHRLIRVKTWDEIPNRSIVKVMPPDCEGTRDWHWVAWRGEMVWCSCLDTPVRPEHYEWRLLSYIGN